MATLPGVSVAFTAETAGFSSGVGKANAELNRFSSNATKASGQLRSAFANVGFQIQDLGVQLASGTSAVRALSQQLPQLLSGFGLAGIAAGTVVAVGGALVAKFIDVRSESEKAAEAQKALGEVQDQLKGLLDTSTTAINDQAAAISRLTGASREFGITALELQLAAANQAIATESRAIIDSLQQLETAILAPKANEVTPGILSALSAIEAAQRTGDVEALAAAAAQLAQNLSTPEYEKFIASLVKSGLALQDAKANAEALETAIEGVGKGTVKSSQEIEQAAKTTQKAVETAATAATKFVDRQAAQNFNELSRITEATIAGAQRVSRERVATEQDAAAAIQQTIAKQKLLLQFGGKETEAYRVQIQLLELKAKHGDAFAASQAGAIEELEAQSTALEGIVEEQEEFFSTPMLEASLEVQTATASTFGEIFS